MNKVLLAVTTYNQLEYTQIFYESFKISYPLTPTIFIGVINSQFDKYMISLLSTVGGVGIYSISQRFSAISWTFMSALQNVFSPTIYKHMFDYKQDERSQFIGKYIRLLTTI